MKKSRPFFSTAVLTIIGRAGGFIIPFIVAMLYGATPATDAFFFAYGVLLLIISLFTHVFESTLIPFLASEGRDSDGVSKVINSVLLWSLPIAVLVAALLPTVLSTVLFRYGGWNQDSAMMVGQYLFEMTPFLIAAVFVAACHSLLFHYKIFWTSAISPLLRSMVVIGSAFFFHQSQQVRALTLGFAAGEMIRSVATFFVLRAKTPWKPSFVLSIPQAKSFLGQMIPQIVALAAVNMLFLSDQWFASSMGEGSLSLLNYADRILQIPYILLMSAFLQIFLTDWSDTYYADPEYHFWPKIHRDIRVVFGVCLALGAGLWFLRFPIAQLLYGRSRLSLEELHKIADLFGWLSLGFIPGVVRLLCGRVLFVMKKSMVYCVQSWAEFAANILLNCIFIHFFGLVGIAMATATVYTISTILTYAYIRVKAGRNISL